MAVSGSLKARQPFFRLPAPSVFHKETIMKPIRTHHTALLIGSLLLLAACNPSAPQTSEAHPASASAAGA